MLLDMHVLDFMPYRDIPADLQENYCYYYFYWVLDIAHISYGNGPHVLALTTTGMVYSWGHNGYGQLGHGTTSIYSGNPALVSSGFTHKVIRIACGGFHSVALMENGEVCQLRERF